MRTALNILHTSFVIFNYNLIKKLTDLILIILYTFLTVVVTEN